MAIRNCFIFLCMVFPATVTLAHDGDHSGMMESSIQLHHVGLPLAVIAISLTLLVFANRKRKRIVYREADDGSDCG